MLLPTSKQNSPAHSRGWTLLGFLPGLHASRNRLSYTLIRFGMLSALLCSLFFAPREVWGQTTSSEINGGNTTYTYRDYAPLNPYMVYNYTQMLYTASELSNAGLSAGARISGLQFVYAFDCGNEGDFDDWVIYLGNTSKTSFASTASDQWVSTSNMTEVFNGTVSFGTASPTNWFTVNFTSNFTWDGTNNLVIAVDENSPNYTTNTDPWKSTDPSGSNREVLQFSQDGTNFNPASPGAADYRWTVRPILKLIYTNCSSLTSAGTVTGNQTICNGGDPAAFSSTAAASGGSGGTIEYQWESSTTSSSSGYSDISGATSATYDVPSGLSATTYYRRKARRCGGSYEQTTSALTVTVIKATRDAPTGAQCSGTTLNFSAVPAGATSYAWIVRTNGTVTYNSGSGFASNTSASVSSGSASSFSSVLTNNTGADRTFYVDVSITASGTTCTQVFTPIIYSIPTTYYSKSTGNLDVLTNWGSNSDGTGCSPANFTADGITYIIQNNAAPTTSGVWAVSGTGSIVKVGNGSSAITFTAGGNLTFTCDLEITGNATLSLGSNNMTLSGDFVRSASTAGFSQTAGSASTVTFSGSSQEVNVTAFNGTTPTDSDITFNHVVIDGTDVKLFYFKTNDRKLNINNFTVNSGKVVTLYSNPQ